MANIQIQLLDIRRLVRKGGTNMPNMVMLILGAILLVGGLLGGGVWIWKFSGWPQDTRTKGGVKLQPPPPMPCDITSAV